MFNKKKKNSTDHSDKDYGEVVLQLLQSFLINEDLEKALEDILFILRRDLNCDFATYIGQNLQVTNNHLELHDLYDWIEALEELRAPGKVVYVEYDKKGLLTYPTAEERGVSYVYITSIALDEDKREYLILESKDHEWIGKNIEEEKVFELLHTLLLLIRRESRWTMPTDAY